AQGSPSRTEFGRAGVKLALTSLGYCGKVTSVEAKRVPSNVIVRAIRGFTGTGVTGTGSASPIGNDADSTLKMVSGPVPVDAFNFTSPGFTSVFRKPDKSLGRAFPAAPASIATSLRGPTSN